MSEAAGTNNVLQCSLDPGVTHDVPSVSVRFGNVLGPRVEVPILRPDEILDPIETGVGRVGRLPSGTGQPSDGDAA